MKKYKILTTLILTLMLTIFNTCFVFATDTTEQNAQTQPTTVTTEKKHNNTISDDDAKNMLDLMDTLFNQSLFEDVNIESGVKMAKPVVSVILTAMVVGVVILTVVLFGQILIDLGFIMIPISRSFLIKQKENANAQGDQNRKLCISDAAYNAVYGSSNNGTQGRGLGDGHGENHTTSALLNYCKEKTIEVAVFVLFVVLLLTGQVTKVVMLLTKLVIVIIQSAMNSIKVDQMLQNQ